MNLIKANKEKRNQIFSKLEEYLQNNFKPVWVKYLDLGIKTVRVINYSKDFTHLVEKQLNYVLRDQADHFDATLTIWQDDNVGILTTKIIDELSLKTNLQLRISLLLKKVNFVDALVLDESYSKHNPILITNSYTKVVLAQNNETNTFYYAAQDLNPEEIIKEGHIFVQHLNRILQTDTTNLVHGASVGLDNKGILFCARGQRGKSTLSVLSMMKGFEYVSDDYLLLGKENEEVYASPIYSIITLSPRMYNELFNELKDSRFLFNNARKDKYVFSIANFHDRFRVKYPIKLCMFPEIVSDAEPSIAPCNSDEKGRAIVQLIQSSVSQMQDMNNPRVIKKIFDMVKDFDFYKINLCSDIHKNTECLRQFLTNWQPEHLNIPIKRMLVDITFGLTNILDTQTFTIYSMNDFATAIYENLLHGVSKEEIINKLSGIANIPLSIIKKIDILIQEIEAKGLLEGVKASGMKARIDPLCAVKSNYGLSFLEYGADQTRELIK